MAELTVTVDSFDQDVLKAPVPVIVDFWAPWCMPCKMIAPMLEDIARQYEGKLVVGKVNVDEEGDLATRYSIASIPSLIVFNKGEVVQQRVGALPRQEIENMFKNLL